MSIGEQIKAMRKIRGLTQKELAEKCSMADLAVRKIRVGKDRSENRNAKKNSRCT